MTRDEAWRKMCDCLLDEKYSASGLIGATHDQLRELAAAKRATAAALEVLASFALEGDL